MNPSVLTAGLAAGGGFSRTGAVARAAPSLTLALLLFFLVAPLRSNRRLKREASTLVPAQRRPLCPNIGTFLGCG